MSIIVTQRRYRKLSDPSGEEKVEDDDSSTNSGDRKERDYICIDNDDEMGFEGNRKPNPIAKRPKMSKSSKPNAVFPGASSMSSEIMKIAENLDPMIQTRAAIELEKEKGTQQLEIERERTKQLQIQLQLAQLQH